MFSIRSVNGTKDYDFLTMSAEQGLELTAGINADPNILLEERGWTLYELDFANKQAVFIDVGRDGDIIEVPFSYSAQMRLAKQFATVTFDQFVELSRSIRTKHQLIQFYNIGHCGSTLLHNVLNAGGEAWGISEPKFVRDIAMNRASLHQSELVALAKAGMAFISLFPKADQRPMLVLKHFSQATKIYNILNAACPDAKNIYMYREAKAWCNSNFGFWQRWGMPAPMPFDWRRLVWSAASGNEGEEFLNGLVEIDREGVTFAELAACVWGLHAQKYLSAKAAGMAFFALDYDELLADREAVLNKLFVYCGLDLMNLPDALKAFDHDAHEGEKTSHEKPVQKLSLSDNERITALLRKPQLGIDPNQMF